LGKKLAPADTHYADGVAFTAIYRFAKKLLSLGFSVLLILKKGFRYDFQKAL
jgi:hypothetical protein